MIQELWLAFKTNFKRRFAVCFITVVSAVFFNVFANPLMKVLWLLLFLAASELYVASYAPIYAASIKLRIDHRNTKPMPIPVEIAALFDSANLREIELRVKDGFYNAYAKGQSIVLGTDLIKDLSMGEILALVAHEVGHIKEHHRILIFLLSMPLVLLGYTLTTLPPIMAGLALMAYQTIVTTPINWYLEARADRYARKIAGKNELKGLLAKLSRRQDPKEPTESHPPLGVRSKLVDIQPSQGLRSRICMTLRKLFRSASIDSPSS